MSPPSFKLHVLLETTRECYVITGVSRNSTIKELKYKLESVCGVPSFLMDLYYLDECALVDTDTLSYYHILRDARLKARVWRYSEKLVTSAKSGNWEDVRTQISPHSSTNEDDANYDPDKALWTLFIGCCHGHEELVDNLLKLGVNYRKSLPSGLDAIQVAVQRGHIKCVELLLRRKVRPHEWNNERMSLTCWPLQDRIKSTLERIEKTTNIQNNAMYSRLTNSQKYDSALPTWYNGEFGQMYLCEILDSTNKEESGEDKPVFRP